MSKFTIVSSVFNQYELLRQFVESINYNVDPDTYEEVIIIDDFSDCNGKLREYENHINVNFPKIKIINFNESRPIRHFHKGPEKTSMGVMCSYQMALEYVKTPYVLVCDTDIVFLSKFGSILNKISELYDNHPNVMSISQLQGHSSDEIFESNTIGTKNMPVENGGAGGPSPMFSTFRIAAWTDHNIAPLASTPGSKRGNGFMDFFLSTVDHGFKVMNFPFFSGEYVFHLGGGTARRCADPTKEVGFGHLKECTYAYGPARDNYVHDYYSGAHKIDMTSKSFASYLKQKYNCPVDKPAKPFDESLLIKYKLHPNRETSFRPAHPVVLGRIQELKAENLQNLWKTYTYGEKSGIDWTSGVYSRKE